MTQKKPYICNNANSCDVRIVIDMSGIKRKGARCQACRYTACLDAGMFHSGEGEDVNYLPRKCMLTTKALMNTS